jgi:protein gp37
MNDEFECYVHNSLTGSLGDHGVGWPMKNLWLGVSVEDQKTADERIPLLLQTPAAVRWVSYEPALGPVDFGRYLPSDGYGQSCAGEPINWVVAGGESGPGARPFRTEWARDVIAQCKAAGVPCFVKQLGAHVIQDGERRIKQDKKGGDMHEWPHDLRVREYPT